MKPIVIILSLTITIAQSQQLYFPDESFGYGPSSFAQNTSIQNNLTQLRGTNLYEEYVDKIISGGILKLTVAVDKAITTAKPAGHFQNIVFAPGSIAAALALVLLGSNGQTFEEISTLMGLATGVDIHSKSQLVHEQFGRMLKELQTKSGFSIGNQVNFATAIFVQDNYPIRSIYKQVAASVYESEIINVDFKSNPVIAQQVVNNWVKERTSGKIPDILKEIPLPTTKVILTSAMYFKAAWEKPFFNGSTRRRAFFPNGRQSKSTIMVDMMSNGGYFPYFKDTLLNCEIMGFPYKGNQTVMYVVMPFNSNQEKLKGFLLNINATSIERLVDNVRYTRSIILFPKMKIDSTIDLNHALQALGLRSLFNPHQANLALLSPGINNNLTSYMGADSNNNNREPFVESSSSAKFQQQENNKDEPVFIFSRTNMNEQENNSTDEKNVISQRVSRKTPTTTETLDGLRQYLNQQGENGNFQNPGLYADSVIHKVYMDITESGTEAAAATSVTLARDGGSVSFRIDVPFFFFIRHEQSKTILFWGSVNTPTPHF